MVVYIILKIVEGLENQDSRSGGFELVEKINLNWERILRMSSLLMRAEINKIFIFS